MSFDLKLQTPVPVGGNIADDELLFGARSQGDATPTTYSAAAVREYVRKDIADGLFYKANANAVAFTKTGPNTISLKAGAKIELNGAVSRFDNDTPVIMPALVAGEDYAIYLCHDGALRADPNFTAPAGYDITNSRKLGGFHYAPGGNAAAQAGGDSVPTINPYSLWDLKWRPACLDPRGMALVNDGFWCDIYLLGVDHAINGTSKFGVTIADGSAPPKIPTSFGGDGVASFSNLNWWNAAECMSAGGKRLLDQAEFIASAYGVTEATSVGADPITTKLDAPRTSRWGIMQATGNLWVWGRDFSYRSDGTAWSYKANTGGRGSAYTQGTHGLVAARLGASWSNGSDAGSRSSGWNHYPWNSTSGVGARGACDHLKLV